MWVLCSNNNFKITGPALFLVLSRPSFVHIFVYFLLARVSWEYLLYYKHRLVGSSNELLLLHLIDLCVLSTNNLQWGISLTN
jgi:hypothetical protein